MTYSYLYIKKTVIKVCCKLNSYFMLEFEHNFIAQICGVQPDDVKAVLDVIRPYLSDEQIFEINKNAQETFDNMSQIVLNNPEDFGLI